MRLLNQRMLLPAAAAACLVAIFTTLTPTASAATADPRNYGVRMFLQIDQEVRPVASIEGGTIRGSVVTEKTGKKHLANVQVEPIRAKCNVGDFSTLINSALANPTQLQRVNGTIYTADLNGKVVASRDFLNAILTEVDFAALDPTSKEPASMTIVLEAEQVRETGGGKMLPPMSGGPGGSKGATGAGVARGFTIDIPGVDAKRVVKLDAITVARKVSENPVGEMRDYQKTPGNWDVSNIAFTVPQSDAASLVKWHEDFVIKGICDDGHEKSMTITAIDATAKPLYTLNFGNVGIIAIAPTPMQSGTDQIAQMRAELYAETMTLNGGSGADGGGGTTPAGGQSASGAPAPSPAPAPGGDKGAVVVPGAPAATATDAGAATATPAPTATATPTKKKRPPAALATAPTLAPAPSPTLTPAPAPAEPVAKPTRKPPRG